MVATPPASTAPRWSNPGVELLAADLKAECCLHVVPQPYRGDADNWCYGTVLLVARVAPEKDGQDQVYPINKSS